MAKERIYSQYYKQTTLIYARIYTIKMRNSIFNSNM